MKLNKLFIFMLTIPLSRAAYYDTLPKGVRHPILHFAQTTSISSAFSDSRTNESFNWNINLNAKAFEVFAQHNDAIAFYLEELKTVSPEAYENVTAGEFKGSANANVDAQAIGFAYGLTNRLTIYGFVPFYSARVDVNVQVTKQNNFNDINTMIEASSADPTTQSILTNINSSISEIANANTYQSYFVNELGYKPVGDWEGSGWGDTEIGVLYRLTDFADKGLAIGGGVVLPTGDPGDPDVIQDINFDDGQWDAFVEFGGGIDIASFWEVDSFARYTYQFESAQRLRIPESEDFPFGSESTDFNIKLGNKLKYSLSSSFHITDWFAIVPEYIYEKSWATDYESDNAEADRIYEINTSSSSNEAKLALEFTTVKLFQSGKTAVPMDLTISGQKVLSGRNTPDYSRVDFDIRLYF